MYQKPPPAKSNGWRRLGGPGWLTLVLPFLLLGAACNGPADGSLPAVEATTGQQNPEADTLSPLAMPQLAPVNLASGQKLRVATTTSIIGDVVGQIGGDDIILTTIIPASQDAHSFEPSAGELALLSGSHIIFVSGWGLEEGLLADLEVAAGAPLAAVSAGIAPYSMAGENEDKSPTRPGAADPHTWLDVANVIVWTENIAMALSSLDPAHCADYRRRAEAYTAELSQLDSAISLQAGTIPEDKRSLITFHNGLGYFAAAYDFEVIDTVMPGSSSLAEPAAADLVELIETMRREQLCAIFVEGQSNDHLARIVAGELDNCPAVQILPLYTDSLGPAGSAADNYIGMMRALIETLVTALR